MRSRGTSPESPVMSLRKLRRRVDGVKGDFPAVADYPDWLGGRDSNRDNVVQSHKK